jgi:hypothetical protein
MPSFGSPSTLTPSSLGQLVQSSWNPNSNSNLFSSSNPKPQTFAALEPVPSQSTDLVVYSAGAISSVHPPNTNDNDPVRKSTETSPTLPTTNDPVPVQYSPETYPALPLPAAPAPTPAPDPAPVKKSAPRKRPSKPKSKKVTQVSLNPYPEPEPEPASLVFQETMTMTDERQEQETPVTPKNAKTTPVRKRTPAKKQPAQVWVVLSCLNLKF